MTTDDPNRFRLISVTSLPAEDVAQRLALAEAARQNADVLRAAGANTKNLVPDLDDWLALAEGLLYSVRATCEEYLEEIPLELRASIVDVEDAIVARDPSRLKSAVHRLEGVSHSVFFPDGPEGGAPVQARMSGRRA